MSQVILKTGFKVFKQIKKHIFLISLVVLCGCVKGAGSQAIDVNDKSDLTKSSTNRKENIAVKKGQQPVNGSFLTVHSQPWQNMLTQWSSRGPCQVQYNSRYMKDEVISRLYPQLQKESVKLRDFSVLLSSDTNENCKGGAKLNGPVTLAYFIDGVTKDTKKFSRLIWTQSHLINGAVNGYVTLVGFNTKSKNNISNGSEKKYKFKNVGQYKLVAELVPIGENSETSINGGKFVGGDASFLDGELRYTVVPKVPLASLKSQTRNIRIRLSLHSSINALAGTVKTKIFNRTVTLNPQNGFTAKGSIKVKNIITGQKVSIGILSISQALDKIDTSIFFVD